MSLKHFDLKVTFKGITYAGVRGLNHWRKYCSARQRVVTSRNPMQWQFSKGSLLSVMSQENFEKLVHSSSAEVEEFVVQLLELGAFSGPASRRAGIALDIRAF